MKISLIIPIYNESKTISSCLNQLEKLPGDWEILFADGGFPGAGEGAARPDGIHNGKIALGIYKLLKLPLFLLRQAEALFTVAQKGQPLLPGFQFP